MDRKSVAVGVLLGVVAMSSVSWTSQEIPPPTAAPASVGLSCASDPLLRLPALESGRVAQAHPLNAPPEMVWIFQCWNGSWQAVATF